jgi:hypothetical protein
VVNEWLINIPLFLKNTGFPGLLIKKTKTSNLHRIDFLAPPADSFSKVEWMENERVG